MLNSLPDTYTQLEYIESTGTQYIDTKYVADSNTKIHTKFLLNNKRNFGLYGGQISGKDTSLRFFADSGSLYIAHGGNRQQQTNKLEINIEYELQHKKSECVINGVQYISSGSSDFQKTTLTICKCNSFDSNGYFLDGRIYYFKIYDSEILVRDFIPCYRNSDNEAGLYDLINNVFYTNQGTGKFIKGPSIINTNNTKTIDWSQSMSQRFEYYEVDPNTWKDKSLLEGIVSTNINKDSDSSTLETADIEIIDTLGECYIRVYLIATQGEVTEKIPFGTYLVQTPSSNFDGKVKNVSMTAYSPLIELKENPVPLGYTLLKNENIMENAYQIAKTNCRAPVVQTSSDKVLTENFVANTEDTYIDYLSDLIAQAKYKFDLDELGQILFSPIQKFETLQPVYTFNDDNSSILLPEVSLKHDIYGIPNVVEVVCTVNNEIYTSVVKNEDPNSPTSIQSRGRVITHRVTDPDLHGLPTKQQVDEYAEQLLSSLSSVEYTINFSHGYYPLRLGDCVRLNYKKAELNNVKAKIISQSIKCGTGCTVSTTATFTKNLWR